MVDCSVPQIAGLTVQNILFEPFSERLRIREAHPDFLHGFSQKKRKNRKHIFRIFVRKMCFLPMFDEKSGFGTFEGQNRRFSLLLQALGDRNCHSDGRADHRVIAHAEEAHHLHVRGHRGGAGELSVGMHTAHCICKTV